MGSETVTLTMAEVEQLVADAAEGGWDNGWLADGKWTVADDVRHVVRTIMLQRGWAAPETDDEREMLRSIDELRALESPQRAPQRDGGEG